MKKSLALLLFLTGLFPCFGADHSEVVRAIADYARRHDRNFLYRLEQAASDYQTIESVVEWEELISLLEGRAIPREKIVEWTIKSPEVLLWQLPRRLRAVFVLVDYFIGADLVNQRWVEDPEPFIGYGNIRQIIKRAVVMYQYPKVTRGETATSEYRRVLFEMFDEGDPVTDSELARRLKEKGLVDFHLPPPPGIRPVITNSESAKHGRKPKPARGKSPAESAFYISMISFKEPPDGNPNQPAIERGLRKAIREADSAKDRIEALRKVMALPWVGDAATFITMIQVRDGADPYEVRREADLTIRAKLCVRTDLSCLVKLQLCLDENPIREDD